MSSDIHNPLLGDLKLPGRIFQLPSRGLFYKNGELADTVSDAEIHVHPLSAMDEIILKNADQLFSGEAVKTVYPRCMTGVAQPGHLLAKDVDALMLFLRVVTYGPGYEFVAKHNCAEAKDHSYIADVEQMIGTMQSIDPTTLEEKFTVTLQNGQIVKLRPYMYQDSIDMVKRNIGKTALTVEDMQRNLKDGVCGMVLSVNGTTDRNFIAEWVEQLPAQFLNRLAEKMQVLEEWGPNLVWTAQCKDCGEEFKVEIPINPVTFFTE